MRMIAASQKAVCFALQNNGTVLVRVWHGILVTDKKRVRMT